MRRLVRLEPRHQASLLRLREAVQMRRLVRLDYCDAAQRSSQREVRPLGCFYWGSVWTLAAWCLTRQDFRSFRLDRIRQVLLLEGAAGRFKDEAGKTLADYLRQTAPPDILNRLNP